MNLDLGLSKTCFPKNLPKSSKRGNSYASHCFVQVPPPHHILHTNTFTPVLVSAVFKYQESCAMYQVLRVKLVMVENSIKPPVHPLTRAVTLTS